VQDPASNARRGREAVAGAVAAGAQIVVLPELANSGYVLASVQETRATAVLAGDELLASWAACLPGDGMLVTGFCELAPDGTLYNSSAPGSASASAGTSSPRSPSTTDRAGGPAAPANLDEVPADQNEAAATDPSAGITRRLVLLLAATSGLAVANMYYAQPLLHTLGHDFGVSNATAGLLVTITQVGYVLGLALLVPLGDLLERRRLITTTLLFAAAALILAAAAPSFAVFGSALIVVGISSVVAQVIVPMSSTLAADHERGRVVGTVMSGLLIGILLARTFSGIVAGLLDWRVVFAFGAAVMIALAATLRVALPQVPATEELRYRELLRSVVKLVRDESVLRQRMALGAIAFGCFSILWTSIAFLLSGSHYHYGSAVIGLFGIAGLGGALIAPVAGRLADRGLGRVAATGAIVILLASWGLLALGETSLPALIAGIVALDLGAQALHISNQSTIYALQPDARSRITTAYMVAYFLGGAAFSAITSTLYGSAGWGAVCVLGAITSAVGLCLWLTTERVGPVQLAAELSRS
jgi:predicted MFS family arabinose efflux permease